SEGLARRTAIPDVEMAYFGGLLHDIGTLPMLSASPEGDAQRGLEFIEDQGGHAAFDHCELGRRIGLLWDFPQPLLEVFEFHHQPEKAKDYRTLVGTVAVAEHFCRARWPSPRETQVAKSAQHQMQSLCGALISDSPVVLQALAEGMESDYLLMA